MLTRSFKGFVFQFCQYIVPKQENFKIFCPFKITRLNIRNFVVTEIKMQQPLTSILYNIKLLSNHFIHFIQCTQSILENNQILI